MAKERYLYVIRYLDGGYLMPGYKPKTDDLDKANVFSSTGRQPWHKYPADHPLWKKVELVKVGLHVLKVTRG